MTIKLCFLEKFKGTSSKGDYTCYKFLDPSSLNVLVGFDLNRKFEKFQVLECTLDFQNGRLLVIEAH